MAKNVRQKNFLSKKQKTIVRKKYGESLENWVIAGQLINYLLTSPFVIKLKQNVLS